MTITISGRLMKENEMIATQDFTAQEATELIKNGCRGMLSFFGSYEIEGVKYFATGVSVGDETYLYEKEGKIVIPTYFSPQLLSGYENSKEKKVFVEVSINPKEVQSLFLTLVTG